MPQHEYLWAEVVEPVVQSSFHEIVSLWKGASGSHLTAHVDLVRFERWLNPPTERAPHLEVCTCIYMHVHAYTYTCNMLERAPHLEVCTCICMHVHTYICIYMLVHAYTCIYMPVHACTCTCICMLERAPHLYPTWKPSGRKQTAPSAHMHPPQCTYASSACACIHASMHPFIHSCTHALIHQLRHDVDRVWSAGRPLEPRAGPPAAKELVSPSARAAR